MALMRTIGQKREKITCKVKSLPSETSWRRVGLAKKTVFNKQLPEPVTRTNSLRRQSLPSETSWRRVGLAKKTVFNKQLPESVTRTNSLRRQSLPSETSWRSTNCPDERDENTMLWSGTRA